ncbi:MAG: YbhB/YbcL family Raf kinase inhibitor-like protein [Candidatus Eremiobacteraeota bacterium]|nr:YbhB/YbcL family Raf kinase inhibitor-like protein [Candidatus Eremiobacteraeota bacterium]MBV8643283.1 YbhB/YbcL family Raf kinase inhibitor-like protein [Candidatus Eremiobacteraeota bacterium]
MPPHTHPRAAGFGYNWLHMETKTTLALTSDVFRDGQTMPMSAVFDGFGCTGNNRSPDLTWSGAPTGTQSYAVTIWDPDAPTTVGFVHWVVFDIPADVVSLAEGAGSQKGAGVGAIQGYTDFGFNAYGGPCPPVGHGLHRYYHTVYALDVEKLGLDESATYALFRYMIRSHTLATAEIVGTYGRPA